MAELAIKVQKGEDLLAVVFPLEGKMQVDDLAVLLRIKSVSTLKKLITQRKIGFHKMGGKWVVDLSDFWAKTVQNI